MLAVITAAAAAHPTTFCNPINIDYAFSTIAPSHREAADPTMVVHGSTYWLFASKLGGYYHSEDMNEWTFVVPTGLPIELYAPMVVVLTDGSWAYTAFEAKAIYHTADPRMGAWTKLADMNSYKDPGMLVDDDGRVYMYSGCADNGTITAVELSNSTWREMGTPLVGVTPNSAWRGFEVGGDANEQLWLTPWVEGAYMNRIGSRYYLQYSVPGTQYKSYADGLYVGDAPTGPFTFAQYSPFSHKPTGFAAGAGHSSTFLQPDGAAGMLWHIGTITISMRHMFERRLGIYPVLHDAATGMLITETYLGDYPQPLPASRPPRTVARMADGPRLPPWMLLSLHKPATSSSNGATASAAFDEDIRTWWAATTAAAGEWLAVDLRGSHTVHAIQINFADVGCSIIGGRPNATDAYRYLVEWRAPTVEATASGAVAAGWAIGTNSAATGSAGAMGTAAVGRVASAWKVVPGLNLSVNTLDRPHTYVELSAPLEGVGALRLTGLHQPGGARLSISGFRIFGIGPVGGSPPARVTAASVRVARDTADPRHATVTWAAAAGAEFYVVRYGVVASGAAKGSPLTHNYQVYGATSTDIRALVAGIAYSFAVDAVNSIGVTLGVAQTTLPANSVPHDA